jgi:cytochrome c oxidase subunit 4
MKEPAFYFKVTAALMLLLAATVTIAFLNLGPFNTVAAMLVSVAKASLILAFFMHLRRSHPLLKVFAGAGFFWLGIMLALALSDFLTR